MPKLARRGLISIAFLSFLPAWTLSAEARTAAFANVAAFRELVMAAFRKKPGVTKVVADPKDTASFQVVVNGSTLTADVTNLYGYLTAYPAQDADEAVSHFVDSLTVHKSIAAEDKNIVAVIRGEEYIEYTKSKGLNIMIEPITDGLAVVYMVDGPDSMSTIKAGSMPGRSLTDIRRIALENVRQWLPKVVSDDQLGDGVLYYVEGNTMLSTTLILLDEFWALIKKRFPGDVLIALPRKDQLFIFDDGDAARAHARQLIEATARENFNLLSPRLFARRGGKIVALPDQE